MDEATKNNGKLEKAEPIEATCPACASRLDGMDACGLGAVGVCPACGELVRRVAQAVEVYPEGDHDRAHPEVLEKLKKIQSDIRNH